MMINFALAAVMVAGGIWFLRASFAAKGFCAMAALTLASSTVMLTRTPRDGIEAEAGRHRATKDT